MNDEDTLIEVADYVLEDNPLKFLVDAAESVHHGNRDALGTLILSRISANPVFNIKLNVALNGGTDVGKTDAALAILNMADAEYRYETVKISPKVLYYQAMGNEKKEIKPYSFRNKTICVDDITDNDTEVLKNIANTTNEPPSFSTLINQVPFQVNFDYAPVVWTTKIDFIGDEQGQADRRFYTIELKDTPGVMKHIFDVQSQNIMPDKSDEYKAATYIMGHIMEKDYTVKIPEFDYSVAKTKSGLKFLIAMIRSIAKINYRKNKIVDDFTNGGYKKVIIASDEDIKNGVSLYKTNLIQRTKLSSNAITLLKHIPEKEPTDSDFDHPELSDHTVDAIHTSCSYITLIIGKNQYICNLTLSD